LFFNTATFLSLKTQNVADVWLALDVLCAENLIKIKEK